MSYSALSARYPGIAGIPRESLGEWPTPAENHSALADELGCGSLWVKRDDLSARAYGGNKVRKLEYVLGGARASGARAVITFGAYGSNHVLATAMHATRLGLEVHAVLTPQPATANLRKNLLADSAAGLHFHVAESFSSAPRVGVAVRAMLTERDGIEPLVVPFGGTSALGTLGFVAAAFELAEQIAAGALPEPDLLYVPLGSAGTAVGLAIGLSALELKTRVQAVRVVPADVNGRPALERTLAETTALLRTADERFPACTFDQLPLDVRDGFLGAGYAEATPEGREAVAAAERRGLSLETTYTGKTLAALAHDVAEGRLARKVALFWNTYNSRPVPVGDPAAVPAEIREVAGF